MSNESEKTPRDTESLRACIKQLESEKSNLEGVVDGLRRARAAAEAGINVAPDWFKYDQARDIVEIHGIKYAGGLFEDFAHAMPENQPFRIIGRRDGVVTIQRIGTTASADNPSTAGSLDPIVMECVKAAAAGYAERGYDGETMYCADCQTSQADGDEHTAECLVTRARAYLAAPVAQGTAGSAKPDLTVWYGAMPESNGKSNFTATLMRKGADFFGTDHYTFSRSEYPDRVRYEADFMSYLIGERAERPEMWDKGYDFDKHSGYVAPLAAPALNPSEVRARFEIGPMPVERDENGWWSHPGIPNFDEDHKSFSAWVKAVGLEVKYKCLESYPEHPLYDAWFERGECDASSWAPEAPAGEGWFTFSIHNTEDGPVWVWARRALRTASKGDQAAAKGDAS